MKRSVAIWKYEIPSLAPGRHTVYMPDDAQVLHVGLQGGRPHIWAAVDPTAPKEPRVFRVYYTGHEVELGNAQHYLGTVQVPLTSGELVLHIFEEYHT